MTLIHLKSGKKVEVKETFETCRKHWNNKIKSVLHHPKFKKYKILVSWQDVELIEQF